MIAFINIVARLDDFVPQKYYIDEVINNLKAKKIPTSTLTRFHIRIVRLKTKILSAMQCAIHWPTDCIRIAQPKRLSVTWEFMIPGDKPSYFVRAKSVVKPIEQ